MLEFDRKTKMLTAYRNKCAIPKLSDVPSRGESIYNESLHYLNNQLKDDVMNIFLPRLREMLNLNEDEIDIVPGSIEWSQNNIDPITSRNNISQNVGMIDYETEKHLPSRRLKRDNKYAISVKFNIRNLPNPEPVTILHIPYVRPDGVIEMNASEYSYIHLMEQTNGISFSANVGSTKKASLSLRTNKNVIHVEVHDKNGMNIKVNKRNIEFVDVMSAILDAEGFDPMNVWGEFADTDIINLYTDEDQRFLHFVYFGGTTSTRSGADIVESIAPMLRAVPNVNFTAVNNRYNTDKLRDELNTVLSLHNAIDGILYEDVVTADGRVIGQKGRVVTEDLVAACNRNGIYKLYIEDVPDITGAILAKDILIKKIPAGTVNTDIIAEAFPEEIGMYTIKDHVLTSNSTEMQQAAFIIGKNTVLTASHVSLIRNTGIEEVTIKAGTKNKVISFHTEIISNRQFRGSWIGKPDDDWYYLDSTGNYVKLIERGYTGYDFVALFSYCTKLFRGKARIKAPNIDEDFRKILVPINEMFHRAFDECTRLACRQMKATFKAAWQTNRDHFCHADNELTNKWYAFDKAFWDYLYHTTKCIRSIGSDAINNPIAYISELTKANVYVGSKHSISDPQRRIAIGSYGKLDPYEAPQSQKIGIVNNICSFANIDTDGLITTPYYRVIHESGRSRVDIYGEKVFLSVEQEENCIIADISSVDIDDNGFIKQAEDDLILCRVPALGSRERQVFEKYALRDIDYININALQPLSWASATIPFLGNNDAARAVFAVAQMKQAKGLVNAEEPYVQTSAYWMIPRLNEKFGYVSTGETYLKFSKKEFAKNSWAVITVKGDPTNPRLPVDKDLGFDLKMSADNSVTIFQPRIFAREWESKDNMSSDPEDYTLIEDGDAVVASNFVSDNGILMFGTNALVAFYADGYDYDDSVHISDTMATKMKSYRLNKEFIQAPPSAKPYYITELGDKGRVATNIYIEPGVYDQVTIGHASGARNSLSWRRRIKHAYGTYVGQYSHMNDKGQYDGSVIMTMSTDIADGGDKMSNRHGNKCTVSRVEPDKNMPRLKNGVVVDVCNNPLGVGSRMNIGQIKEAHMGLICHVLQIKENSDAYNAITDGEINMLMSLTVDCMNSPAGSDVNAVFADTLYRDVPEGLREHIRENIMQIRTWAGCFSKRGTTKLILPMHDGKLTETEVTIGYIYMFKLIQESHKKVHARANDMADEPYTLLTDAPTHGAAKMGGQRMGTMEIDALCAYGVSDYIHEVMNERSDNAIARQNFDIDTFLSKKLGNKLKTGLATRGQRRSVTQFLYMLLALGIYTEADEDEIIPLSSRNNIELKHLRPEIIQKANHKKEDRHTEKQEQREVGDVTKEALAMLGINVSQDEKEYDDEDQATDAVAEDVVVDVDSAEKTGWKAADLMNGSESAE